MQINLMRKAYKLQPQCSSINCEISEPITHNPHNRKTKKNDRLRQKVKNVAVISNRLFPSLQFLIRR